MRHALKQLSHATGGQALIEAAITLPLVLVLAFAVIEIALAQVDSHIVTTFTREGSNLISRSTTLGDAASALDGMTAGSVDFGTNATVILSVIKRGATTGSANYDKLVLYQRHTYGALSVSSRLVTAGSGSFGPGPDYVAVNSDNDTNLRVQNLPLNAVSVVGGLIYVTEVFFTRSRVTPVENFGVAAPETLYSVAYF